MACEGLIYNVPLNGGLKCTPHASDRDLREVRTEIVLEVQESGFYYFIFTNENEITDNFLSAQFDLHKTVFDVSSNVNNCTNSTECVLPLTFWSHEHVVLEVPEKQQRPQSQKNDNSTATTTASTFPYDPCSEESLLRGFSSLAECRQVIQAESICTPRRPIYMLFLFLVPIFILFCAHI